MATIRDVMDRAPHARDHLTGSRADRRNLARRMKRNVARPTLDPEQIARNLGVTELRQAARRKEVQEHLLRLELLPGKIDDMVIAHELDVVDAKRLVREAALMASRLYRYGR